MALSTTPGSTPLMRVNSFSGQPTTVSVGFVLENSAGRRGHSRDRIHGDTEFRVHLLHFGGIDAGTRGARCQVVHTHRAVAEFPAQRFAEAAHAELGGRIHRIGRIADAAEYRAGIEDVRGRLPAQMRQQQLRHR